MGVIMAAAMTGPGAAQDGQPTTVPDTVDLSGPEYNPANCPAWAKEQLPAWAKPYMGYNGLPAKWRPAKKILGSAVKGLDRYQANNFVFYCPATAEYLYKDYTPQKVDYTPGTLPAYERVAAQYTAGCKTDTEKAEALLRAMAKVFRHPTMPPLGPAVGADRNLEDEALLATGCGFCNEQARVFIRLCQVCRIPARMLHLFGQGHTVTEFFADGRWVMADATNLFIARGKDGQPLSAAQCHDRGEGQRRYAEAKQRRMLEMANLSDEELGFKDAAAAAKWREGVRKPFAEELATRDVGFGVVNYPLPK
jgi:hypothetical protein